MKTPFKPSIPLNLSMAARGTIAVCGALAKVSAAQNVPCSADRVMASIGGRSAIVCIGRACTTPWCTGCAITCGSVGGWKVITTVVLLRLRRFLMTTGLGLG